MRRQPSPKRQTPPRPPFSSLTSGGWGYKVAKDVPVKPARCLSTPASDGAIDKRFTCFRQIQTRHRAMIVSTIFV